MYQEPAPGKGHMENVKKCKIKNSHSHELGERWKIGSSLCRDKCEAESLCMKPLCVLTAGAILI